VDREYGDGPVRLGSADVLKIRFHGRPGDRVRLSDVAWCPVSLLGPTGRIVRVRPDGFWRLSGRGLHTFALTRCRAIMDWDSARVQLEKLRVTEVVTDGAGVRLDSDRGFIDAVRVRVPAHGRLQVTTPVYSNHSWGHIDSLVLPDGSHHSVNGWTLWLEDAHPIATEFGRLHDGARGGPLVAHAGQSVTLLASGRPKVFASIAQPVSVTVDGPPTALPPGDVPYRQYQVEFDAVAGTWLHNEVTGVVRRPQKTWTLLSPHGKRLRTNWWQVPKTGHYRLMLPMPSSGTGQVRIRTIRIEAATPVDGTHLTLSTSEPGQWVLAPMTLAEGVGYQLHSHSATTTGDWRAFATMQRVLTCPHDPTGCGDHSYGWVSSTTPTSEVFGGYQPELPWMVLLAPDPGVSVSVDVSVSPYVANPPSRPALR
jgi:hypothetical protein